MSYVRAEIGGKAKGIADQVSIDLALGCKNKCIGCYAKKSSQRGSSYDVVTSKDLDKKILQKSIRNVKAKGFQLARVGKHCDPGDHIDSLNSVLDCCNDESFRCVVVSKSLIYNRTTAQLLSKGNHILHMSMGPYTDIAPRESDRLKTAERYIESRVKTAIRLTRDITMEMNEFDTNIVHHFKYIVTPMRYPSMLILDFYRARSESYDFVSGYYRPKTIHCSWKEHMNTVCGEINNEIKCCNCLVD